MILGNKTPCNHPVSVDPSSSIQLEVTSRTPPMKSIAQPPFAGDAVSVELPSNMRLIPGSDSYLVNIALLPCYNSTPKDIMDNSFAIDMSFYRLANSPES